MFLRRHRSILSILLAPNMISIPSPFEQTDHAGPKTFSVSRVHNPDVIEHELIISQVPLNLLCPEYI